MEQRGGVSRGRRLSTRITVALVGATAVVAAELAALTLSTRLSVAVMDGGLPAPTAPIPVVAVAVAAIGLAVVVDHHASNGATLTASGVALVVAAPLTAFGGGCGIRSEGIEMFRSGVRIGIAVEQCVTFLNGALLVLGYALLAAGLWLAADRLPIPGRTRWRSPKLSD